MIDRPALLSDLQKLLQRLEADLHERSESAEVPDVEQTLHAEYERAKKAERTAQNYEDWRSDAITQTAAAWVLSCVFVRFLEDNRLIDPPKISGPAKRLQRARDEHELYFREHLKHSDRDYLLAVFDQLATLPVTKDVFGEHNAIRELPNWLSGDAAGELLRFFQKIDANTGALLHDFTDPNWDTRFLGDLYQDLSEAARKKYALLQTPEFVEEFILDRTLNPALDEFGLDAAPVLDKDGKPLTKAGFRMIDPACGSGHFLLGAFPRILDRWQRKEPGTNIRELAQRALDSVFGVDVNPYAVAIARFRLLLAAMRACNTSRVADAPGFRLNLACGDSLLHAPLRSGQHVFDFELTSGDAECDHAYQCEDLPVLKRMLRGEQYHAVVANPPYITPKDRQLNERYRRRFKTCHMKYSLAVPFLERIFRLAVAGGYTGQITANSFMKREFGKKVIESFFPTVDLTHVIDTSGAYIPGHGTPTVILFGRHRSPMSSTLRTVMGIRGEPATPADPARGLVWSAIVAQLNQPGSRGDFVSVGDSPRALFHKHPWSIGGGGAAEVKERLEQAAACRLKEKIVSDGFSCIIAETEVFSFVADCPRMRLIPDRIKRAIVVGPGIRDWTMENDDVALFPYDAAIQLIDDPLIHQWLWPYRSTLEGRPDFSGVTYKKAGRPYWEYHQIPIQRNLSAWSIAYASIASHNHFVLSTQHRVFRETAPIITLPSEATPEDHIAMVGYLNSAIACFWLKQVSHQKQMTAGDGIRFETKSKVPYAFSATQVDQLPLPSGFFDETLRKRLIDVSGRCCEISVELAATTASRVLHQAIESAVPIEPTWRATESRRLHMFGRLVFLQEEIDFLCYAMWGFVDPAILCDFAADSNLTASPGQRPFEILAKANPEGFEVATMAPSDWPVEAKTIWNLRIQAIEKSPELRLIEDAHYKRRWIGRQGKFNTTIRSDDLRGACSQWLLDRLESYFDFDGRMKKAGRPPAKLEGALVSVANLADIARQDAEFQQVGELYRDDPAFDVQALVAELVASESVPLLPVARYKPSGLIKRGTWERTWDLQRQEDAIDARTKLPSTDPQYLTEDAGRDLKRELVGDIPVPTKYDSKDFLDSNFWRLRGKLDVPKERWISFPHCEGPDGTLVICWAGYDHLQQARAISAYYVDIQERLGGRDDPRLIPLLACLLELLPWLKHWHNEVDPEYGMAMGDYFEGFVNEEARQLGKTIPEVQGWQPPQRARRRGRVARDG